MLQVLEMGAKSGIIELEANRDTTRIQFENGVPVHAELSKQPRYDAALSIVNLEEGRLGRGVG